VRWGLGLALLVLAWPGAAAAQDRGSEPPAIDPNSIFVKFEADATAPATVTGLGDRFAGRAGDDVAVVDLQPGESVAAKVDAYDRRADVVYAEPIYARTASLEAPDDPGFGSLWWPGVVGVVGGWSIYPGSYGATGGVSIAIVDTGIDSSHEDLAGRVAEGGASCTNPDRICVPLDGPSVDDQGHGTHVAGIAGAATGNGVGVVGLAFSSPLVPVKVLDRSGRGFDSAIANGITWAHEHGARVINLSLGGPLFSQTLCDAVGEAAAAGVLVVAAAGNGGLDRLRDSAPLYPAACPGAVGVAATAPDDSSPVWSNWDYPNVFVSAPGVEIYSTLPGGRYDVLSGTSMATPFVAALGALLLGQAPTRTAAEVKRILAKTSDKVGEAFGYYDVPYGGSPRGPDPFAVCGDCTWHPFYGYGRINVERALTGIPPEVTGIEPATGAFGTVVTVSGSDLESATSATVNGVPAEVTVVSSTEATVTVPPEAAGTGEITVTTPAGSAAASAAFHVLPRVASLEPTSAAVGDVVTVSGGGFAAVDAVAVGGVPVETFTLDSATRITITVPDGAVTGPVTVTTADGSATSDEPLTILP
jgi:thermitase